MWAVGIEDAASEQHPGKRRRRISLAVAGVVVGLAVGVGIDVIRVGGIEAWLARRLSALPAVPPYEARGRAIDVDGRAVYLDCRGTNSPAGSPTVLLEAGLGSGASGWGAVLDGVAAFTRVCAWDRPGLGRSAARGLHSGREAAEDLRAALDGAAERGPLVVVAHSLGGVYARLFAASEPGSVLAFVMLDTYEPDLGVVDDPALDAEFRAVVRKNLDETAAMIQAGEDLDWAATLDELAQAGTVQLPAILLTVDPHLRYVDPDPAREAAMIDAWYRGIAARYPNGRLEVVPDTGHLIQLERPGLVIERIREVVLRYRSP